MSASSCGFESHPGHHKRTKWLFQSHLVRLWCVYSTKSEPIFKISNQWSSPRATRLCAKHRASAEAEVRENALHSATMFLGERRRSAEMRNASEILRNAGGLGESISQNSLRVLPDFLVGISAGINKEKYTTLKSRQSRDTKLLFSFFIRYFKYIYVGVIKINCMVTTFWVPIILNLKWATNYFRTVFIKKFSYSFNHF